MITSADSKTQALILLYHRVIDLPSDPQLLCVSPENFDLHLQVLRCRGQLLSLRQLVQGLREGQLPSRAVCLTFDDGYADNLENAKPLLEQYEMPATVFVTFQGLQQDAEFWWDELDRLFLEPGHLPERLSLMINGKQREWDLGTTADYSQSDYEHYCFWNVLEKSRPTQRQVVYGSLCELLRPLPAAQRELLLEELRVWAGDRRSVHPSHRRMSANEIRLLAQGTLIEIGAHTLTHPILAFLTPDRQRREILECKAYLEQLLGHPVHSFSYPYGTRSDFTADTVAIVKEAGFDCACANHKGGVKTDSDLFQLARLIVRDWDRSTFAGWLQEWWGHD